MTPIAADALLIQCALNAEETLFQENERPPTIVELAYEITRLQDSFRDKVHVWFALTPKVQDYEWLPSPRHLIKLHYLLRPLRLSIE